MLLIFSITIKVIFVKRKVIRKLTLLLLIWKLILLLLMRKVKGTIQNLLELKVKGTNQNIKQRIKEPKENGSTIRRSVEITNHKHPVFQQTYYQRMIHQSKVFQQHLREELQSFLEQARVQGMEQIDNCIYYDSKSKADDDDEHTF